jgi:hypothetical protein
MRQTVEILLILWLASPFIGAAITNGKGRGVLSGFLLGGFLSFIGIAIAAALSPVAEEEVILPPAGMKSVRCTRCNAVQNVPKTAASAECWQCHQTIALTPDRQRTTDPATRAAAVLRVAASARLIDPEEASGRAAAIRRHPVLPQMASPQPAVDNSLAAKAARVTEDDENAKREYAAKRKAEIMRAHEERIADLGLGLEN